MTSPDSDQRFHSNPELLVPIDGIFAGKDILSVSQFDQRSFDKLFSVVEQMEQILRTQTTSTLLRGVVIISVFDKMNISAKTIKTRFAFESSILRLGGSSPLYQELPAIDDPYFDYRILDIKGAMPDAIIITHPDEDLILRAASVLRSTQGIIPLINAGVFDNVAEDNPLFAQLENGLAPREALLAMVLGKIK